MNTIPCNSIVNSIGSGIFVVQDGRVVFHNKHFAKLTGFTTRKLNKMQFIDLVHPKDKKLINILFNNNFKEIRLKQSKSYTYRINNRNGELLWLKSNVSIIKWEGRIALLNSCYDISTQKEYEEKLLSEEQNFRFLVNAFEDFVFIINKRFTVVQANSSVYERLDVKTHNVILKNFSSFFPEDERDNIRKLIAESFLGQRLLFKSQLIVNEDTIIPVEVRFFLGNWSQKQVVFAVCQDISQRIENERIIMLSEEKFSKAFDNNAVMMTISTFYEGRFIDVNETFLRTSGLNRNDVIGKSSQELNIFPNISKRKELLSWLNKNELVRDIETTMLNSKGEELTVTFSADRVRIQDQDCILIVMSDISKRKELENELIRAKEKAEEASKVKEQFLSTMSHEIRTPMNAIIGMTNILLSESPTESQKENLKTLRYSADNLMSLLNDILDYSKIEAGKLKLLSIPFNIKDLAEGVFNTFKHMALKKNLDISLNFDSNIPEYFVGDPIRINQILTNLTSNAIKFTEKGGVLIKFSLVYQSKSSASICFAVSDTGIGIPLEKQSIIFQEFTQANVGTSRRYGGSGLGLAISKQLATLLNSEIIVESIPGKGSTFSITLTLTKSKAKVGSSLTDSSTDTIEIPHREGKPYRILIVEDNEINSMIADRIVQSWGFLTEIAENGSAALEMICKHEFDVIIMDLEMPIMNGYEATVAIRNLSDPQKKNIPIIALSASALIDVQSKIFSLGMNEFVLKPFNPKDLKRKIVNLLSQE